MHSANSIFTCICRCSTMNQSKTCYILCFKSWIKSITNTVLLLGMCINRTMCFLLMHTIMYMQVTVVNRPNCICSSWHFNTRMVILYQHSGCKLAFSSRLCSKSNNVLTSLVWGFTERRECHGTYPRITYHSVCMCASAIHELV